MANMRNQVSPKTGKIDIIDRHTKGRTIIIDSDLLFNGVCQDYMMLLIDLAELSDYIDVIVTCKPEDINKTEEFLDHWMLQAKVKERYTEYKEILAKYRILFCFVSARNQEKYKDYYHSDCFTR